MVRAGGGQSDQRGCSEPGTHPGRLVQTAAPQSQGQGWWFGGGVRPWAHSKEENKAGSPASAPLKHVPFMTRL